MPFFRNMDRSHQHGNNRNATSGLCFWYIPLHSLQFWSLAPQAINALTSSSLMQATSQPSNLCDKKFPIINRDFRSWLYSRFAATGPNFSQCVRDVGILSRRRQRGTHWTINLCAHNVDKKKGSRVGFKPASFCPKSWHLGHLLKTAARVASFLAWRNGAT